MQNSWQAAATSTKFSIEDLAKLCQGGDNVAVTKQFIKATSYILSSVLNKGKPAKKLWDSSKFAIGQWFSQTAYLCVRDIKDKAITVENQYGDKLTVTKDILEKMYSATHFKQEVPCTMTELAEVL